MPTLYYRDPNDGTFKPVVGGSNVHGELTNLDADDHPQYLRKDGGTMSAALLVTAPTQPNQPVRKMDFDAHNHAALGYKPITISKGSPTGGVEGDVWMVYT